MNEQLETRNVDWVNMMTGAEENGYREALLNSVSSLTQDEERQIKHALDQTNSHKSALSNSYYSLIKDNERQIKDNERQIKDDESQIKDVIRMTSRGDAFGKRFQKIENEPNHKKKKLLLDDFEFVIRGNYDKVCVKEEEEFMKAKNSFYALARSTGKNNKNLCFK